MAKSIRRLLNMGAIYCDQITVRSPKFFQILPKIAGKIGLRIAELIFENIYLNVFPVIRDTSTTLVGTAKIRKFFFIKKISLDY